VSLALATAVFAMIYKLMPRVRIAWRDVWIGAAFTAVLFTLGKTAIALYIGKSGVTSGFGAAASVVALLVWVYWSAQIFLIGAEFTWVWAHRVGSRRGLGRGRPVVASSGLPNAGDRMDEEQR
jgi:membrane protein